MLPLLFTVNKGDIIKVESIAKFGDVELYKLRYNSPITSIIPQELTISFNKKIEEIAATKPYTILNTNPKNVFERILVVGIII